MVKVVGSGGRGPRQRGGGGPAWRKRKATLESCECVFLEAMVREREREAVVAAFPGPPMLLSRTDSSLLGPTALPRLPVNTHTYLNHCQLPGIGANCVLCFPNFLGDRLPSVCMETRGICFLGQKSLVFSCLPSLPRRLKRVKRTNKEENMWDCSVCTYRNSPEAFKCLMCDVRKGTSTRKPRLNAELVAAQVAQVVPPKVKKAERKDRDRKGDARNLQKGRPRLKNVDRSTAQHNAVTVNNVTVIITEFQPKHRSSSTTSSTKTTTSSGNTSSATNGDAQVMSSSEAGSISDASTDTTRNGDITTESRSS